MVAGKDPFLVSIRSISQSFLAVHVFFVIISYVATGTCALTLIRTTNFPSSGSVSVILFGRSGSLVSGQTLNVRMGVTSCGGSLWTSDTACQCLKPGMGGGGALTVALSIGSRFNVAAISRALSYNVAAVHSLASRGGSSGSESAVVFGQGFGMANGSFRLKIGSSSCESVRWRSSSSITCKTSRGATASRAEGSGSPMVVTVASLRGSHSSAWSYCACAALILSVNSVASTGSARIRVAGQGVSAEGFSARARFSRTAFSSTLWNSESSLQLRSSAGFFDLNLTPLVISVHFTTKTHSSALSYFAPAVRGLTSLLLAAVSVTGANFGTYPSVVAREVTCKGWILQPMQTAEVCIHDDLAKFRESPVPITQAVISLSFADALRMDDVRISLVSPSGEEFFLMRKNCFGCFKSCGQSTLSSFSFQIPTPLGRTPVPEFLCPNHGDYEALDSLKLQEKLGVASSMGRWSVRVSSGSQLLNITQIYFKFETSTMEVRIGGSAVSALAWVADSSVVVVAPGYQFASQPSAAGWGRNLSVTASLASPHTGLFSYPDPKILHVVHRDVGLGSGSNLVSVTGSYFANIDATARLRFFETMCVRSAWASDTSVSCHAPKVSAAASVIYASIESSSIASYALNLTLAAFGLLPISASGSRAVVMPATGAHQVEIFGSAFGTWDASVRVRLVQGYSATSSTTWLHDSAIALSVKPNPSTNVRQTLLLSAHSASREFDVTVFVPAVRLFGSPQVLASTGAQAIALSGIHFGVYPLSAATKVVQTAAEYSVWFSDSSARCKVGSGRVSVSGGVVVSFESNSFFSPAQFQVASPVISNITVASAANESATHLQLLALNAGTADPFFRVFLTGTVCSTTLWISDSRINCLNSWPLSRDYVDLEAVAEVGAPLSHSSVFMGHVPNPEFVAAPKAIALSFIPAAFIFMSPQAADLIAAYARYGLNFAPPAFLAQPESSMMVVEYAELLDIDTVFVCNHTQVYLKDYRPIQVIASITFDLMHHEDRVSLNYVVCGGSMSLPASLPANLYAAVTRASLSFCSNSSSFSAFLRLKVDVKNETGSWISFTAETHPFRILAANRASLLLVNNSSTSSEFVVGKALPAFSYRLDSDSRCDRVQFSFAARLSCVLVATGEYSDSVPFYAQGNLSALVNTYEERVVRSCAFNVTGMIPVYAGECSVVATVLTFPGVFIASLNMSVINDEPSAFKVSGFLAAQLEEGDIIWSMNSSSSSCLHVSIFDKFGNRVTQCHTSFKLIAASINGSMSSNYRLYGPSSGVSDCRGGLMWCSTRVTVSGVIQLNLSSPYFNARMSPLVRVAGQGAAAQIAVLTPKSQIPSTIRAGETVSSIQIQVTNAVGTVLRRADSVVVKIRVVSKAFTAMQQSFARSSVISWTRARMRGLASRLLLGESVADPSAACPGGGDQIVEGMQQSTTGIIVVENVTFCAAGGSEVVYDIGYIDANGEFVPLVINAFSTEIAVIIGPPSDFRLLLLESVAETSYTPVQSRAAVVLHDRGLNVVNGSVSFILSVLGDAALIVSPSSHFEISCDSSNITSCLLPAFIFAGVKWSVSSSTTALSVFASGYGTHPLVFTGDAVDYTVTSLCLPGQYVNLGLLNLSDNTTTVFRFLSSADSSNLCASCPDGKVSDYESLECRTCRSGEFAAANHTQCIPCGGNTWSSAGAQGACLPCPPAFVVNMARDKCVTLAFSSVPPVVLSSFIPFGLPPVIAVDNFNRSVVLRGDVSFSLSCSSFGCSAVRKGTLLQSTGSFENGSVLFSEQVIYDDSDSVIGIGYSWILASSGLTEYLSLSFEVFVVAAVQVATSAFLGPPPVLIGVTPLFAPFFGNSTITVTSSVWNILNRMTVFSSNRTAACHFTLWDGVKAVSHYNTSTHTVEARSAADAGSSTRTCAVPEAQPFLLWNVSITLADGRRSINNVKVEVVCPASYYVLNNSCSPCPYDENVRSFNELNNAPSIESCRCAPGAYGTFGFDCRRCAPLEGFNCSLPDQVVPFIRPGYYGDYSQLSSCSWKSQTCAALLTCPFGSRACPGGGDLTCTSSESECYTGRACSRCCPMFYLENSVCNRCPDPSATSAFLAAMAAFALVVAVLLASASSPSFTQCMKYFVLGMSFLQNLVSIKMINVDWPVEFVQMFEILSFFSFSIGAVRPECSFSWTYEYKVVFSLLLPLVVSLLICIIGIIYGVVGCRRLQKKIEELRRRGAKLPYMSTWSVIDCWLHALLFRAVQWRTELFMWFALSPHLENRTIGRRPVSASVNWHLLRTTLQSAFQRRRTVADRQPPQNHVATLLGVCDVREMQCVVRDAALDASFASLVLKGRKFASGIFSVLVLFFVGSLTASIGALICQQRDDSEFLVQDPTVECSYSSERYTSLVAIAVTALVLYVALLPAFLVVLLRSRWSKDMRTADRNGYDALFGFLTSRYSLACYMWECVMFVQKGFSVMIPAIYYQSPLSQSVSLMFVSLAYVVLLFKYSPFANNLMNAVEKSAAFSIFLMYFIAVMFVCEVDGKPVLDNTQKSVAAFFLIVICSISAVFCFLSGIYEYFLTLLFHGDVFVSKWIRAFHSAIGDSLNESLFLYFYAFYNPKSRKSLVEKKRVFNESIASLMAVKHSDSWKYGSSWNRLKLFFNTLWRWIRFGVRNRNLAECQPMMVHEALQYPEARLFQRLSKILHFENLSDGVQVVDESPVVINPEETETVNSIDQKSQRPSGAAGRVTLSLSPMDPPAEFMVAFSSQKEFVCNLLPPESLGILVTMIIFDQQKDMSDSKKAQAYLQHMKSEFDAMKKSLRSIYAVSHEIIEEEERVQQRERWIVRTLKRILLGEEGACLFRFSKFSSHELDQLFGEHDFDDFSKDEMLVIPVPQLIAAQLQVQKQQKSLQTFLRRARFRKTSLIADASSALLANAQLKPVLHQNLLLNQAEDPPVSSLSALKSQRTRPQMYAAKAWRSAADRRIASIDVHDSALSEGRVLVAGIKSILVHRSLAKQKVSSVLHQPKFKNSPISGIRSDAVLNSLMSDSDTDMASKANIHQSSDSLLMQSSSSCIWVSKSQALSVELSQLEAMYKDHNFEEDAKVASLENDISRIESLLTRSVGAELQVSRSLQNLAEDLKNLRSVYQTLQTSKDFELEQLQKQFAYELSLKNAQLYSKDAQLRFFNEILPIPQRGQEVDPIEGAGRMSLNSLRHKLSFSDHQSINQELSRGTPSADTFFEDQNFLLPQDISNSKRENSLVDSAASVVVDSNLVSLIPAHTQSHLSGRPDLMSAMVSTTEHSKETPVARYSKMNSMKQAGTGVDRV